MRYLPRPTTTLVASFGLTAATVGNQPNADGPNPAAVFRADQNGESTRQWQAQTERWNCRGDLGASPRHQQSRVDSALLASAALHGDGMIQTSVGDIELLDNSLETLK